MQKEEGRGGLSKEHYLFEHQGKGDKRGESSLDPVLFHGERKNMDRFHRELLEELNICPVVLWK